MKYIQSFIAVLLLASCATFPDLEPRSGPPLLASDFPRIEPLGNLLIRAIGPSVPGGKDPVPMSELNADLDGRIANLNRRASILRGSPVDATTRGRLAGG